MVSYQILQDEDSKDVLLLLLHSELGVFFRDLGEWLPLEEFEDELAQKTENLFAKDIRSIDLEGWDIQHKGSNVDA